MVYHDAMKDLRPHREDIIELATLALDQCLASHKDYPENVRPDFHTISIEVKFQGDGEDGRPTMLSNPVIKLDELRAKLDDPNRTKAKIVPPDEP